MAPPGFRSRSIEDVTKTYDPENPGGGWEREREQGGERGRGEVEGGQLGEGVQRGSTEGEREYREGVQREWDVGVFRSGVLVVATSADRTTGAVIHELDEAAQEALHALRTVQGLAHAARSAAQRCRERQGGATVGGGEVPTVLRPRRGSGRRVFGRGSGAHLPGQTRPQLDRLRTIRRKKLPNGG
eukprot:scaffold47_cov334-Pavlova_lutheri.AAC.27